MSLLFNGKPIDMVTYPNNETLLRPGAIAARTTNTITLKFESDADLFRLQVLAKSMPTVANDDLPGFRTPLSNPATLVIPYMPYSRADRSEHGSIFTLKLVCELINELRFRRVIVVEPHSEVTAQLLNNCEVWDGASWLLARIQESRGGMGENDWIIYPDKGAAARYKGAVTPGFANILMALKTRDFETGKITDMKLPNVRVPKYSRALIIDDLCSKGGTFVWCADLLREMGFDTVELAVTHLEPAGYNRNLLGSIDHIYTSDSIAAPTTDKRVTVYPLGEIR